MNYIEIFMKINHLATRQCFDVYNDDERIGMFELFIKMVS